MDAGLTWVGPDPDAIAAMGSKVRAKELMREAGVPVLDAVDTDGNDAYPVLVKASSGGGGRGMRIVRDPDELPAAFDAARAEAESAFGDPAVFVEPYLETARHIEVQILGDRHGTCWVLGERDCSIQRRHQKIVEETPAPDITDDLRASLHGAAADAAKAIGYVGAGTVEFLVDVDPVEGAARPYFLEMNTRLQVEHPVTECVTGFDLVALQLDVAEGHRLDPAPPPPQGHAVEVRLYAEDPTADWRPQTGTVRALDVPDVDVAFGPLATPLGLRLDSGVDAGTEVGVHYDPMLAKLIAWAPTRAQAIRRLASALRRARIHGVTTNRDLLAKILTDEAFAAGAVHTGLLTERLGDWAKPPLDEPQRHRAVAAAALAQATATQAAARVQSRIPPAWRSLASQPRRVRYRAAAAELSVAEIAVAYTADREGLAITDPEGVTVVDVGPDLVTLEADGVREAYSIAAAPDGTVDIDGPHGSVTLTRLPRFADPTAADAEPGSLLAPMPGVVTQLHTALGEQVASGASVLTLEAMKMQHEIRAPIDGVMAQLDVRPGTHVDAGAVLAVVEPTDPETLSGTYGALAQHLPDNSPEEEPT